MVPSKGRTGPSTLAPLGMPRNFARDRAMCSLSARQKQVLWRFFRHALVRTRVCVVERALLFSAHFGAGTKGVGVVLDLRYARSLQFDDLSARLRERPFIRRTRQWLMRLCHLTVREPKSQRCGQCVEEELPETINVVEFVQAYKIASHPARCLEDISSLDPSLYKASEGLLSVYEKLSRKVHTGTRWEDIDSDLKSNFPKRLAAYVRLYKVLMRRALSHGQSGLDC